MNPNLKCRTKYPPSLQTQIWAKTQRALWLSPKPCFEMLGYVRPSVPALEQHAVAEHPSECVGLVGRLDAWDARVWEICMHICLKEAYDCDAFCRYNKEKKHWKTHIWAIPLVSEMHNFWNESWILKKKIKEKKSPLKPLIRLRKPHWDTDWQKAVCLSAYDKTQTLTSFHLQPNITTTTVFL